MRATRRPGNRQSSRRESSCILCTESSCFLQCIGSDSSLPNCVVASTISQTSLSFLMLCNHLSAYWKKTQEHAMYPSRLDTSFNGCSCLLSTAISYLIVSLTDMNQQLSPHQQIAVRIRPTLRRSASFTVIVMSSNHGRQDVVQSNDDTEST